MCEGNGKFLDLIVDLQESQMLSWENDLSQYEEKLVVATFTPAMNKIRGTAPVCLNLLRVLCFCDPEKIPISIFIQGCSALQRENSYNGPPTRPFDELEAVLDLFQSRVRLSKAIQEVQRLSLVAYRLEGTDRIIWIHDLVHLLLRLKLMTNMERGRWLEIVTRIICKAFGEIGDHRSPENWSRCGPFISHIEALEKFAEQYRLEDNEILGASMWAAMYLDACGLYEKAAIMNKRALNRKTIVFGERHPSTLTSMNNLAEVLERQGKYEEAEGIHRQTLAMRESVVGEKHPNTLTSLNNLAGVLRSLGKYKEAEGIYRQTLTLRESVLRKKHPSTLSSMNNLALVLESLGEYEEAEGIYHRTQP